MDDCQEFLLNLAAYLVVGGAGILIAAIALATAPYVWRRPLPLPRLRAVRWSGAIVILAVLTPQVWQVLAAVVVLSLGELWDLITSNAVDPLRESDSLRLMIHTSPIWIAGTLVVLLGWLCPLSRMTPDQLGLSARRGAANLVLGVALFLTVAPVTLAVYYGVIQVTGSKEHDFERLARDGLARWEWPLFVFMTVVGAPLVEETLFRGIVQSWLRRASLLGHAVLIIAIAAIGAFPLAAVLWRGTVVQEEDALAKALAPLAYSALLIGGYVTWLIALKVSRPYPFGRGNGTLRREWANARLGVYGSAALFALAHGWPQSVPLFLLGLALGWLALRTQSLIGPMVCHGLFNSVACLALYWSTCS